MFSCSYLNIFSSFFFHDFSLHSCLFPFYYSDVSNRLYIYIYIYKQRIHSFQLEIHSKPFIVYPLGVRHCSSLEDGDAVG